MITHKKNVHINSYGSLPSLQYDKLEFQGPTRPLKLNFLQRACSLPSQECSLCSHLPPPSPHQLHHPHHHFQQTMFAPPPLWMKIFVPQSM